LKHDVSVAFLAAQKHRFAVTNGGTVIVLFDPSDQAGSHSMLAAPTESTTTGEVLPSLVPDSDLLLTGYRFRVVTLHLLLLLVCCLIAFHCNRDKLFLGYDGVYYRTIIKLQHTWMPGGLSLSLNPVQALGNIFFTINSHLSPGFSVAAHLGSGEANPLLVYTTMALETFLSLLLLSRLLGVPATTGYGAAWLMTLLSFPFTPSALLYPISGVCPQYLETVALLSLLIGLFWQVGRHGWLRSLACTLLGLAVLLWAVLSSPWMPILFLPVLGLISFGVLLPGHSRQRRARVLALAALLLALAPTVAPYVLGNYLYSVPTFFTGELDNMRVDRIWTSVVFHGPVLGLFGPILVIGSTCGALLSCWHTTPIIRGLAIATLTCSLGLIGVGLAVTLWMPDYVGPSPLYFEICLWPFYCLFFSIFLGAVSKRLLSWGTQSRSVSIAWRYSLGFALLPLACMIWSAVGNKSHSLHYLAYPLPESPIVQTLRREVGLIPGCRFRGGVATFTGSKSKPDGVNFLDLIGSDCVSLSGTGNDHRALGLWYYGIPTLYEYNQFMTPAYYAAMSRLLARPADRQMRSVIVLTRPNLGYLRSLGIRYLVTDFLESSWAAGNQFISHPEVRMVQSFPISGTTQALYLYELTDTNLCCYSPTRVRVASTAHEILAQLGQPDFEFRSEALATTPLPEPLVPASNVQMTMHKGYVQIEATSPGTSVLLLPLQYSHCLELEPLVQSEGSKARLVRLNLLQAGLVFSGSLQARIRFASGPFRNSYGRLLDYFDMKSLKLDELCRKASSDRDPWP